MEGVFTSGKLLAVLVKGLGWVEGRFVATSEHQRVYDPIVVPYLAGEQRADVFVLTNAPAGAVLVINQADVIAAVWEPPRGTDGRDPYRPADLNAENGDGHPEVAVDGAEPDGAGGGG